MRQYLARRVLQAVVVLGLVSLAGFSLLHLAPGGPAAIYAMSPTMAAEDLDRITRELGLDRPLHVQYLSWARGFLTGNWGRSYRDGRLVLEVIREDYIRTAHAKGVAGGAVIFKHALKNALIPLVTLAGLQLPLVFSGALVTETIFTWPGMGRLFVDSIGYRDYLVLMGLLMFTALLVVLGNLVADLVYGAIDPRVRLS